LRLRLIAVDSDDEGLAPDAVDQALSRGARAIYLTATNDNPTTATMSLARRKAIVAVARRHGAAIIEDDAYGLLPVRPLPPLASLAPELVWYVTGTSKIISPVLRVAHLRLPEGAALHPLARDVHETSVMAPPLNAALVTLWLRNGWFDRLVAGVRAEAVARQRIAAKALAGLPYAAHPQGYHLWLRVPSGDVDGLIGAVRPLGLSAVAADAFAISAEVDRGFVRLSMGGPIDHARLERALRHAARLCGART
jgi:DNA-binding transcriptional MocR family regulator